MKFLSYRYLSYTLCIKSACQKERTTILGIYLARTDVKYSPIGPGSFIYKDFILAFIRTVMSL